ncbi:MAG: hypothetical protein JWR80_5822 [Bradyrhizobium sp.]|nr:hypothetical protein [Bradyrhizobium sp.]
MPGPTIPQYGNFGGNGENDAWDQADRYATFTANGYNAHFMATGPEGSGSLPDPHDYPMNTFVHVDRTSANTGWVKSILSDIDRAPINDLDTAYLNHDLFYAPDSAILNVINNVNMGNSVWEALVTGGSTIDAQGYIYGLSSIPFIVGPGSAYNVLNQIKNHAVNPLQLVAEEVIVVATNPLPNQTINITAHLVSAIGEIAQSVVNFSSHAWSSFTSAVGSGWSNITGSLGSAWQWFQETILHQHRAASDGFDEFSLDGFADDGGSVSSSDDSPFGHIPKFKIEYIKVNAGDHILTNALKGYDDNHDGLLTTEDNISAFLGIFIDDENSTVKIRSFDRSDAIDVITGLNNGAAVSVGATRDFLNAVNTLDGSETASSDMPVSAAFADPLKVSVAGSSIAQIENWVM